MPMNPAPTLLAGLAPGAYSKGARRTTPPSMQAAPSMTPDQRAHAAGNDVIDDMLSKQSSPLGDLPSGAELNQEYRPVNGRAWGGGPNYMRRVQ